MPDGDCLILVRLSLAPHYLLFQERDAPEPAASPDLLERAYPETVQQEVDEIEMVNFVACFAGSDGQL